MRGGILQAHDEAMAAKEAAMEERIADLDKQSQRQDQLLKNQLGRIGDNRKKLSGMGDQMSKLTELANEGEEVADVLGCERGHRVLRHRAEVDEGPTSDRVVEDVEEGLEVTHRL